MPPGAFSKFQDHQRENSPNINYEQYGEGSPILNPIEGREHPYYRKVPESIKPLMPNGQVNPDNDFKTGFNLDTTSDLNTISNNNSNPNHNHNAGNLNPITGGTSNTIQSAPVSIKEAGSHAFRIKDNTGSAVGRRKEQAYIMKHDDVIQNFQHAASLGNGSISTTNTGTTNIVSTGKGIQTPGQNFGPRQDPNFCQTEEGRGQSIDRARYAMQNKGTPYRDSLSEIQDIMKRIKFVDGDNFKRDPAYFKDRPKVEINKGRGNYSGNPQNPGHPRELQSTPQQISHPMAQMNPHAMQFQQKQLIQQAMDQRQQHPGQINVNNCQINIGGIPNGQPKNYKLSGKEFGMGSDKIT